VLIRKNPTKKMQDPEQEKQKQIKVASLFSLIYGGLDWTLLAVISSLVGVS